MNSSNSSSGGIGFCGLLTVLFIALKLTGFIGWSWLWVLAPIRIPLILLFVLAVGPRPALCRRDRALGPLCDGVHLHELRRHSAGHGRTRNLRPVDRGLPQQAPHPQARDVAAHRQGLRARHEKRRRPQPCLQGLPRHPQTGRTVRRTDAVRIHPPSPEKSLQNRKSSTRFGYWISWWARVDSNHRS